MGKSGACETFTCLAIDDRPVTKYGNGQRKRKLKRVDEWLNMKMGECWRNNKHAVGPYLVKGRNCRCRGLPNEDINGSSQRTTASTTAEASLKSPARTLTSRSNSRNYSLVEATIAQGDWQLRIPSRFRRDIYLQNYRRGHHWVWGDSPVNSTIKKSRDCMCMTPPIVCILSILSRQKNN